MHKIAFICVDYNGWEYTQKLCASLERQNGRGDNFSLCCVVVDNSTDEENSKKLSDSLADLEWAIYCPARKNHGYFGGLNIGMEKLSLDDWDFVIICNNDLDYDINFCRSLILRNYSDAVFSVCPDVITFDGFHQNPHVLNRISSLRRFQFDLYYFHYYIAWTLSSILKIIRPVKMSPPQPKGGCEIHMGIGACYVLTRGFLNRFKRLIYPHFLYGEEAFFSEQIHSAGGILWFDPELVVHHAESAATKKMPKRAVYEFARQGYSNYRKML